MGGGWVGGGMSCRVAATCCSCTILTDQASITERGGRWENRVGIPVLPRLLYTM